MLLLEKVGNIGRYRPHVWTCSSTVHLPHALLAPPSMAWNYGRIYPLFDATMPSVESFVKIIIGTARTAGKISRFWLLANWAWSFQYGANHTRQPSRDAAGVPQQGKQRASHLRFALGPHHGSPPRTCDRAPAHQPRRRHDHRRLGGAGAAGTARAPGGGSSQTGPNMCSVCLRFA